MYKQSTFIFSVIPIGLSGSQGCMGHLRFTICDPWNRLLSYSSVLEWNYVHWFLHFRYIRHRHGKLYVDASDGKDLFKKDSTFNVRYGLAATQGRFGISFESFNHPGWFIGHTGSSFRLAILKKSNSKGYKMLTTWMPVTSQIKVTHQSQQVVHKVVHHHRRPLVRQVQSK